MSETSVLWEETVEPGAAWSHVLKRGTSLRITDMEGGANVGAIFYNFECPAERFNLPDTLKAQHVARLTKDLRAVFGYGTDFVFHHRRHGGLARSAGRMFERRSLVACKYGAAPLSAIPQRLLQATARDSFLMELEKWGLGPRDLTANVNFFSRVDGGRRRRNERFMRRNSMPRSHVELRAEMNVLTILNTCPHPLDPNPHTSRSRCGLSVRKSAAGAGRRSLPASPAGKCARVHADREVFRMSDLSDGKRRSMPANATYRSCDSGGRFLDSRNPQGRSTFALSIWRAIRRWTRCSITRTITPTAIARRTRFASSATSI